MITPAEWVQNTNEGESLYSTTFAPALPGTDRNELHLAFHAPGDAAGSYDLGAGGNADADTCEQCISALAGNAAAPTIFYFQHEGQLDVSSITFATVTATFTGVQLAEVDGNGAVVAGGTCLRIADGTIEVEP